MTCPRLFFDKQLEEEDRVSWAEHPPKPPDMSNDSARNHLNHTVKQRLWFQWLISVRRVHHTTPTQCFSKYVAWHYDYIHMHEVCTSLCEYYKYNFWNTHKEWISVFRRSEGWINFQWNFMADWSKYAFHCHLSRFLLNIGGNLGPQILEVWNQKPSDFVIFHV